MAKIPEDNLIDAPSISRRPALDYFTPFSAGGRILRLFSTREKIVEGLKTLAWVIPLTVLIWVYAEREQLVQAKSPNVFSVPVHIYSHDAARDVEPAGDSPVTVNLKLTGTQEAVLRVHDKLTMVPRTPLMIDIGSSLGISRNQPVNVVDHIQSLDLFKSNGVTVEESQPSELFVNIDALHTEQLKIDLPPGVTNLTPNSRFDPAKVTVSGPATLLRRLDERGLLHVYPDLSAYTQLLTQPGDHVIPGLPLMLSEKVDKLDRDKVRIDPAEVNATISMIAIDESFDLESVPILVLSRPELFTNDSHYVLELKDNIKTIPNVRVTGPHDEIAKLRNKQFPYAAWIKVSEDDAGAGAEQSQKVTYQLPAGVTPSPEAADFTVEYKVSRVSP